MNISYNWLNNYIKINNNLEELSKVLTQIGLEGSSITDFESIEGGLSGLFIGHVLTCEKHPNADKLSITTVDVGTDNVLNIVCGAPNVAVGQKVVVATIGTTLYTEEGAFEIKKSKIRGVVSEGMICAEDEIGVGQSHDGIMVLPEDTKVGIPASEYFKVEKDKVIEIDLTPNRVDAASHIGVARDLAAFYKTKYTLPEVKINIPEKKDFEINVEVENTEACPRYMGICMTDIVVTESPDIIKNKLKAIGINPINNIVDITNYVLHETGQPLHAFDGDKIDGNKIIVKTVEKDTPFTTLDEVEHKLTNKDLMICNAKEPMCIAGVFGGVESGITNSTNRIFIESAYFNPTWVRKTAKTHGISTDSSFRFERGADVNMAPYALKRAASMIQELGFGKISSDIIDIYDKKIEENIVKFNFNNCDRLLGQKIDKNIIINILKSLEISIIEEDNDTLLLKIPTYRVDVTREADVIEDILRIYGYNNINNPEKIEMSINRVQKPDSEHVVNAVSDMLVAQGFNEIMCNSLIGDKFIYEENEASLVKLHNPLSKDLCVMRYNMLLGGLGSIEYNINRKNTDLKLFEFGRTYHFDNKNNNVSDIKAYSETKKLAIWITGKENALNWNKKNEKSDYFYLKAFVKNIFLKLGIDLDKLEFDIKSDNVFKISQLYAVNGVELLQAGIVSDKVLKHFDITQDVFYAEINMDNLLSMMKTSKTVYTPVSKFPNVKRDLSLLIDKNVTYKQLKDIAIKTIGKHITKINLFDVYEGKNIGENKISYALSYTLEDRNKTMTDKQIDKMMKKLILEYEKIGAVIR